MTKPLSWPNEGVTRIPPEIYTDAEIYAREQERIFHGRSWSFVGFEAEIPKPGDFVRSTVGETPVIVTRDQEGKVNVVVNRCAHKGVQFCTKMDGNTRSFVCPYHRWSFDLRGRLFGVPFRKGANGVGGYPADFDMSKNGLTTLEVTTRGGVIFASFEKGLPPLDEYIGKDNLYYFDRVFDGRPLKLLGRMCNRVRVNWKALMENLKDPYHATTLHTFFATFAILRPDVDSKVVIDQTGGTSALIQSSHALLGKKPASEIDPEIAGELEVYREDFRLKDPSVVSLVREFKDDETTLSMLTVWPNVAFQQNMNSLGARKIVPRGPDGVDIHWYAIGYEDDTPAMTAHRLRNANVNGPAGLINSEDFEVMHIHQKGAAIRPRRDGFVEAGGTGIEGGDLVVTEAAVRAFYTHYRRVMDL